VAAVGEVVERGRAVLDDWQVVIVFQAVAVTAIDTAPSVKGGWRSEVEGEFDLGRDVTGPASHLAKILAVGDDSGDERFLGDLFGYLRVDRRDPGDVANLAGLDARPAALRDFVADDHDHFRFGRSTPSGRAEAGGEGVGDVGLERLVPPVAVCEPLGFGFEIVDDRVSDVGLEVSFDVD
jgi:hypothetical protein